MLLGKSTNLESHYSKTNIKQKIGIKIEQLEKRKKIHADISDHSFLLDRIQTHVHFALTL